MFGSKATRIDKLSHIIEAVKFDTTQTITIPSIGDCIGSMVLYTRFNRKIGGCHGLIGLSLIDKISIRVGNRIMQSYSGEAMNMILHQSHSDTRIAAMKYDKGDIEDTIDTFDSRTSYTPLYFWFNSTETALPLYKLTKGTMVKVIIKWASPQTSSAPFRQITNSGEHLDDLAIIEAELLTDHIFLSKTDQERRMTIPYVHPIIHITESEYTIKSDGGKATLVMNIPDIHQPIMDILWVLMKSGESLGNKKKFGDYIFASYNYGDVVFNGTSLTNGYERSGFFNRYMRKRYNTDSKDNRINAFTQITYPTALPVISDMPEIFPAKDFKVSLITSNRTYQRDVHVIVRTVNFIKLVKGRLEYMFSYH